jgi:hypothetical protein
MKETNPLNPQLPGEKPKRRRVKDSHGLQAEIRLLKEWIRRVDEMAQDEERLEEAMKILDKLGKACVKVATLLKAEKNLRDANDLTTDFNKVMENVLANYDTFHAEAKKARAALRDPDLDKGH